MGDHANATLVRRLFEAFEHKDGFALRSFFADDAVWRIGGRSVLAGEYRGPREIVRFLGTLPRLTAGTYGSTVIDTLASDTRAAVLYRARGEREGRTLDIEQVLLFTIRDGLIADVLALPGDPVAFDRFWG
jgi:ketosteroid isomerase-like protein